MSLSNFPAGVASFGVPLIGGGMPFLGSSGLTSLRGYLFVDGDNGADGYEGLNPDYPFATIQRAIDVAASLYNDGVGIMVAPKRDASGYDETVTIARTLTGPVYIIGGGGRGATFIDPSTEDANGMIVHADDVTLVNVGIAAEDTTAGNESLIVTGSRFRAYGCKLEGGAIQALLGPGTVALEAAGTQGRGGDMLFEDCEFCWGTDGVWLQGTDFGGVTQVFFKHCLLHNLTGKHITENVGSGGAAAVTFFNFLCHACTFMPLEDGTAPTNYIDLNADNANTGVVSNCIFPTAIDSGKNLVSTAVLWTGNFHTGGLSTGQPS